MSNVFRFFFFFQAEDGIRDADVTGVQTCALAIFVGMKNGDAREKSKRRTHQKIIVPFTRNGGIGIHSLQNGVVKLIAFQWKVIINPIVSLVNKLLKQRQMFLSTQLAERHQQEHGRCQQQAPDTASTHQTLLQSSSFFHNLSTQKLTTSTSIK